jgi:hypothetical protein
MTSGCWCQQFGPRLEEHRALVRRIEEHAAIADAEGRYRDATDLYLQAADLAQAIEIEQSVSPTSPLQEVILRECRLAGALSAEDLRRTGGRYDDRRGP